MPKDVGEILNKLEIISIEGTPGRLNLEIAGKSQAKSQLKDLLLRKLPKELEYKKEDPFYTEGTHPYTTAKVDTHNKLLSQVKKMIEEVCK